MRQVINILVVLTVSFVLAGHVYSQDVVHTRDGLIFKGRIVDEFPGEEIIIRDIGGNRYPIAWENIERIERGEWLERKNPSLSLALSFILPGLGQFYNGEKDKGIAMLAIHIGSAAFVITSTKKSDIRLGAAVGSLNWLWSFIDAPYRSGEINKERGYQ